MYDTIRDTADELAALRTVFQLVRQGIFVVDRTTDCIVDVNAAACDAMGRGRDKLIGCPWASLSGQVREVTVYDIDSQGSRFVAIVSVPATGLAGPSAAPRDALTGLATREALRYRVPSLRNGRSASRLALLFIDLDGFKEINDTWGHAAGDRVLCAVAQRLVEIVRPVDLIVRYGGDEFLVVVEGVACRGLEKLAERLARTIEMPILVDGRQTLLTASIGIAQRTSRTESLEELIDEADREMYRAKAKNRATDLPFASSSPQSLGNAKLVVAPSQEPPRGRS